MKEAWCCTCWPLKSFVLGHSRLLTPSTRRVMLCDASLELQDLAGCSAQRSSCGSAAPAPRAVAPPSLLCVARVRLPMAAFSDSTGSRPHSTFKVAVEEQHAAWLLSAVCPMALSENTPGRCLVCNEVDLRGQEHYRMIRIFLHSVFGTSQVPTTEASPFPKCRLSSKKPPGATQWV